MSYNITATSDRNGATVKVERTGRDGRTVMLTMVRERNLATATATAVHSVRTLRRQGGLRGDCARLR